MLRFLSAFLLSMLIAGCEGREPLVDGYVWVTVDGDEDFIEKDGNVVIDDVSRIISLGESFVVESWTNEGPRLKKATISCRYHLISIDGVEEIPSAMASSRDGRVIFENQYSCGNGQALL